MAEYFTSEKLMDYGSTLLKAIVIFVICFMVMKIITKLVNNVFEKTRLDKSIKTFTVSVIKIGLWERFFKISQYLNYIIQRQYSSIHRIFLRHICNA